MVETCKFHEISLLERIKSAESNEKLGTLNAEGNGYVFASDKTRRRWKSAGLTRENELIKVNEKPQPRNKNDKKGSKRKERK